MRLFLLIQENATVIGGAKHAMHFTLVFIEPPVD